MASTVSAQKEDRVVFTVGPKSFSVRDVIDAAHFRGELEAPWRELLLCVAAEKQAEESGAEVESSVLEQAAVDFRYQYELITAEETEAWLEARALDLTDFGNFFARNHWSQMLGGRTQVPAKPYADASTEERELLVAQLVFSGELDRRALELAWRVGARAAAKTEADAGMIEEERSRFLVRSGLNGAALEEWLRGLGRDQFWLEEMLALEACYRARCANLLTAEALEREIGAVRLPLTRFEVELIELESRDAAREAFMCVDDDGMSMAEVAQEGRYPFRQTEMVLEQIAPEQQQKFLSLTPGSVLEPTARADGFVLYRLLGKHEPKVSDPEVRARLEQRILRRHFADLIAGHVRWRLLLGPPE